MPQSTQHRGPTRLQELTFDDDGFLIDPAQWNEQVAQAIAALDGVGPLTPDHWGIIHYMREHHFTYGSLPPTAQACHAQGLCAGVRQAGQPPGAAAAAEEVLHGVLVQAPGITGLGRGGQGPVGEVMLAHVMDDAPMVRGERADAVQSGDGLGDLLVPLGWVDQEAVIIEGQFLQPGRAFVLDALGHGLLLWGGGLMQADYSRI